ncbi:MAG: alpha-amylase family glycosyl hydrolase, partial [Spirochaetales bacterium]|nr:alpha-amylase family glycosyl hydrolase [Spirochaetales bacterium]
MGLPDRKLSSPFTVHLTDGRGVKKRLTSKKLARLIGNQPYRIKINVCNSAHQKVFLVGNMDGEEFITIPMNRCSENNNCWIYEGILPKGGFLRFTAFMESDMARYWDPCGYREILVDPPLMRHLRMYSFIPGVSGRFSHWIKDLDHIKEMGFNAVHLLPLTEMGYTNSPYAAKDLYTVDPAYGTAEEFERFVKACIEKEIALCFDVVLNHVSCDSELARNRACWIQGDVRRRDGLKRAGCWHGNEWISWEELVLIDYNHPDPKLRKEIWEGMENYLFHWASLAERTGGFIRLDNLHSSHQGFIQTVISHLHREYPGVGIFSEFFHSHEELQRGVREWGLNLLLANSWEYPFVPQLTDYLKTIHHSPELRYLLMPTTHDTESVSRLFGGPRSIIPRYFVCALMGSGQVGLTMGTEWGEPEKINFINRPNRVRFEREWDFSSVIGKINKLHSTEEIFHKTGNIEFLNPHTDSLLVCRRSSGEGRDHLLLVANFDTSHKREFHYSDRAEMILSEGAQIEGTEWGTRIIAEP